MDVERIKPHSPTGGPEDWDFAERSVRAYCSCLNDFGIKPTLFVVPDTAEAQRDVLLECAETYRAEIGFHIHPQCLGGRWRDPDAHEYLGGYSRAEQAALIAEGVDQWVSALGFQPRSFRGGNFSANDETFGLLVSLGFTHGSVSQPGRQVTRFRATWADAVWDIHRPHEAFRCAPGDLDFVEVPLTSDRTQTDHWTGVGDVRLEGASPDEILKASRQEIARQVENPEALNHACILTHNFVNFWSCDESQGGRRGVLEETIRGLQELGDTNGLTTVGATTQDVRAAYLKREKDHRGK